MNIRCNEGWAFLINSLIKKNEFDSTFNKKAIYNE